MKYFIPIALVVLIAVQLFVPARMIISREQILNNGNTVRFETAPIDPVDPFRGNYVQLSFKENSYRLPGKMELSRGEEVYVLLKSNANNYATIVGLSKSKPVAGSLYVLGEVDYVAENLVYFNFPFERFYMEEFKAPKAESAYFESRIDSSQKAYADVRVLDGRAVIKNIYINDTAIADLIKHRAEK